MVVAGKSRENLRGKETKAVFFFMKPGILYVFIVPQCGQRPILLSGFPQAPQT